MGENFGPGVKYYEFELDSLDADQAAVNGVSAIDWPLFQIGGKKPLENIVAIKILEVQIPFTWYVFNSTNNQFVYQDNLVGPFTITFPIGNYTATQVTVILAGLLNAVQATWTYTVTYDSALQKFTIWNNVANAANAFALTFGASSDKVGNTNPALLLGYNPGVNTSNGYLGAGTNFGVFLTAPNVMSVTGPNYLYINSTKVGNLTDIYLPRGAANLGGGNAGPQMAKVPINVQPGGVIYWSDPNPDRWFDLENLSSLTEIDFYLSLGNTSNQTPLQLNGQPFSVKLGLLMNDFSNNTYSSGPQSNDRVRSRVSKR